MKKKSSHRTAPVSFPDRDFLPKWGAASETKLDELAQGRKLLWPVFAGGLVATALVWLVALTFPTQLANLYSGLLDSNVGHYGEIANIMALAIPFAPPFVAVFAIGNILFPATTGSDLPREVLAGYNYSQKATRRWQIMLVAGICGALNCFSLMVAWLIATGN